MSLSLTLFSMITHTKNLLCTVIISSWTSDKASIDYVPEYESVNLDNFIPNEEWIVVSFHIRRKEVSCSTIIET